VNSLNPEDTFINYAAGLLKNQELVAFPTETVYGLGADVFCTEAVKKIFEVKGRPPENPLLVHVSRKEQVESMVTYFPEDALTLIEIFWPGPLSIILPADNNVSSIVRGGKSGIGFRMPAHPVALKLIDKTGPLAAPSANLYGHPSPVTAQHVKHDLNGRIAAVLDAGKTGIGIESTIIDMEKDSYKILRRGGVPVEAIEEVLDRQLTVADSSNFYRYKTDTEVLLAEDYGDLEAILNDCFMQQKKTALVSNTYEKRLKKHYKHLHKDYELDLSKGSAQLYSLLRDCEVHKMDVLVFAPVPSNVQGIAASMLDRIRRAASKKNEI